MSFSFVNVIEADASTLITSDVAVVSGLTLGTKTASIIGAGQLSIDGGTWGTTGQVQNGSTIQLRVTTPAGEDGTVTTVTLNVISVGYIYWTVANKDNLVDEEGSGEDEWAGFTVAPMNPMSEGATGADTLFPESYVVLVEVGQGNETLLPDSRLKITVIETGTGEDAASTHVTVTVAEAGAGIDEVMPVLTLMLNEAGVGQDTITHLVTTTATLLENGSGVDAVSPSVAIQMNEAGTGIDTLLVVSGLSEQVDEFGIGNDLTLLSHLADFLVSEVGTGDDEVMPHTLVSTGYTEAAFGIDELIYANTDHSAHVFNATLGSYAHWSDVNVSEVFTLNGTLFGIAPDGLYVLATEQGVGAQVYAGLMKMKTDMVKRLPEMFIEAASTEPVRVGVVAVDQGDDIYEYEAVTARTDKPTNTRVPLGKGLRSAYFGITLANTNDAVTRLGEISFSVAETKRRS